MTGDVHSRNSGRPSHALTERKRPLRIALAITAAMMLVEAAGGFLSHSLALLADAGHMLTDVAALGLGLFAFWLSARPRTSERTFGWRRFEIFAAFLNGLALWVISGFIGYEAFLRLKSPQPVKSGLMLTIAALGLVANITVGTILFRSRERNLNIRGAFLHVVADALGSVGVLAAALLIKLTGSYLWDPIVSAGVCVLILWSSGRLIRDSFRIFMEGAPAGLDIPGMNRALVEVPGVLDVHDFHVWTITSGFISLSAHLTVRKGTDPRAVLRDANNILTSRFGIRHSTIQTEEADEPSCPTGTCEDPG
ncbi:MAG: cation diffusion facilitator family transporter [Candidatus Aminicenantes bacterium]|nr:cation diffusion facilitator family transporter [Candidatus Aminicenantes bacterium]